MDVETAFRQDSLIQLDSFEALSSVMVNNLPDRLRCSEIISDLVARASKSAKGEHARIAICGECSPTLLLEGNVEAAIRLEQLWNENTKDYNVDTLCGYLWSAFPQKESIPIFKNICAQHSAVVGRELGY